MHEDAIRSQFHAALSMMQQAVEECPPTLWNRAEDKNRYWQVAYHAVFYTHLYLQPALQDFTPWSGHIPESESLSPDFDQAHDDAEINPTYTKEELQNYIAFCHKQVDSLVPELDLDGESGFHWLQMTKLELQFYSMRHLQLHIGELAERLSVTAGIEVDWKSSGA